MTDTADAERRVRSFAAMGAHRTGRSGDRSATSWMISELASVGVEASAQEFAFPLVSWSEACLLIDGAAAVRVDGVPLFDGALESRRGVLGRDIAVGELPSGDQTQFSVAFYPYLVSLRETGARAVVLVMGDPDGQPVLRNAEFPLDPLDVPVLQVAPNDAEPIRDALTRGAEAELVISGGRETATAANVVASIAGTDPAAVPVTLMTPKSGWYTCAAERGGGIAVWMAVAGRMAARPGRRTLRLVASSGHELHHLGLDHYIRELGDEVERMHAWMHLGASIGSRNGSPRFAASDEALFELAASSLDAHGIEREPFPVGDTGYGEARNIGEIGGRFVSLLGGHPYFHSPQDTYDRCIDADAVVRHIDAVEQIARELTA